jgi:hypothetical protein
VRKLQPIIEERIDALLGRLREFQASSTPLTLDYAFSAFTNGLSVTNIKRQLLTEIADIAQEYAFARSDHRVEQHDFEPTFRDAGVAGSMSGALIKQFNWILPLMLSLPDSFMIWLDPNMASYLGLQTVSISIIPVLLEHSDPIHTADPHKANPRNKIRRTRRLKRCQSPHHLLRNHQQRSTPGRKIRHSSSPGRPNRCHGRDFYHSIGTLHRCIPPPFST